MAKRWARKKRVMNRKHTNTDEFKENEHIKVNKNNT